MKRTCLIIITLCLSLLFNTEARAQHEGPYIGALIGGSGVLDSKGADSQGDFGLIFNPGLLGSAVIGWDFEPGNPTGEGRIELEYSRRSNTLDQAQFVEGDFKGGGKLTSETLLINFIGIVYDKSSWYPYAMIGAGASRIAADLTVNGKQLGDGTSTVLAYQAGAGINLVLNNYLSLDLGYRFNGTSRPEFTEAKGKIFKMDYFNHSGVFGLRVGF